MKDHGGEPDDDDERDMAQDLGGDGDGDGSQGSGKRSRTRYTTAKRLGAFSPLQGGVGEKCSRERPSEVLLVTVDGCGPEALRQAVFTVCPACGMWHTGTHGTAAMGKV